MKKSYTISFLDIDGNKKEQTIEDAEKFYSVLAFILATTIKGTIHITIETKEK